MRREEPADPVIIYSDATGAGKLASVSFFSRGDGHLPTSLAAKAGQKLQDLAATPDGIYIFELFAAVATVSQFRGRLWVGRVILFVDNEAD